MFLEIRELSLCSVVSLLFIKKIMWPPPQETIPTNRESLLPMVLSQSLSLCFSSQNHYTCSNVTCCKMEKPEHHTRNPNVISTHLPLFISVSVFKPPYHHRASTRNPNNIVYSKYIIHKASLCISLPKIKIR